MDKPPPMQTCKIARCKRIATYVGHTLCANCYDAWLQSGELPGPIKVARRRPHTFDVTMTSRTTYERLLRHANAVVDAARKWAVHDETLASAIRAYDERGRSE